MRFSNPRTSLRYAFYLLPPAEISLKIAEIHGLLAKQFGIEAAGKFQVHATIKGFFLLRYGMEVDDLQAQLDAYMHTCSPIETKFLQEHRIDPIGVGLNMESTDNGAELNSFRSDIVEIISPYIDPDCDFMEEDLGYDFQAHVTLAFRDIPIDIRDSVLEYIHPLIPELDKPFISRDFQFCVFHSNYWQGPWWEDLTWERITQWRLS